jgi:hypothetical protein
VNAGRCAKWAAKWTGLAAALLLLAFDASAQGQSGPPSDQGNGAGPQRMGQGPHRQQRGRDNGAAPQQGAAPATGPVQFAADDAAAPRGGRMSREERRQLRRDVDQAGRDIYPERRRAGRHQQPVAGPSPGEPAPAR